MQGKKKAPAKKKASSKQKQQQAESKSAPTDDANKPELEETNEDSIGDGRVQKRLPGQERVRDKKLEKLADELDEKQKIRIAAQAEEKIARDALTEYMRKNTIPQYDLPGDREAELDLAEPKAKVHKKKAEKKSDDDDE